MSDAARRAVPKWSPGRTLLWSQGVVFDDGMLVFGVRQGWAGVVGVAPEVGDPVGAQGGRQV